MVSPIRLPDCFNLPAPVVLPENLLAARAAAREALDEARSLARQAADASAAAEESDRGVSEPPAGLATEALVKHLRVQRQMADENRALAEALILNVREKLGEAREAAARGRVIEEGLLVEWERAYAEHVAEAKAERDKQQAKLDRMNERVFELSVYAARQSQRWSTQAGLSGGDHASWVTAEGRDIEAQATGKGWRPQLPDFAPRYVMPNPEQLVQARRPSEGERDPNPMLAHRGIPDSQTRNDLQFTDLITNVAREEERARAATAAELTAEILGDKTSELP
jgi:hypothetical protein